MYHEATYIESEIDHALRYGHSTAKQAAEIAKAAEVRQVVIGHFSSRYENDNVLLEEAKKSFENTILAVEGLKISL